MINNGYLRVLFLIKIIYHDRKEKQKKHKTIKTSQKHINTFLLKIYKTETIPT